MPRFVRAGFYFPFLKRWEQDVAHSLDLLQNEVKHKSTAYILNSLPKFSGKFDGDVRVPASEKVLKPARGQIEPSQLQFHAESVEKA